VKIRIIAANNRGVFIGVDSEQAYYVLSLQDTNEIEIGDVMTGDFSGSSTFGAINLTKNTKPWICVEDWECSLIGAVTLLLRLGDPETIHARSKSFPANSDDVIHKVSDEILRIQL